jgi:hypothetical protein
VMCSTSKTNIHINILFRLPYYCIRHVHPRVDMSIQDHSSVTRKFVSVLDMSIQEWTCPSKITHL